MTDKEGKTDKNIMRIKLEEKYLKKNSKQLFFKNSEKKKKKT